MKKVLIGLLVLAVAGGGVFAQEWQFNGEMRAGLGLFVFEDDDDPFVGIVSEATNGMRTDLRARVNNADNNAGLDFLFRAQGDAPTAVGLAHGFGWLNFMDNMLTLQGGMIDDAAGFNSFDRMTGTRMGEGTGLRLLVRPVDGLVLGFGLYGHHARDLWTDDETHSGQLRSVFSFSFTEPDLFRIVGGARSTNEAVGSAGAGGYTGWGSNHVLARTGSHPSAAYVSFEYLGLNSDGIHISASAFFMNLEDFGDYGDMRFFASFGHTGLVDGMDLRLNAGFGMNQHDVRDDVYVWIWGSVDYQLTDSIVPRLDVHYVMGGTGAGGERGHLNMNHRDPARDGASFNSDDSFVRIQPSVQFRVQANTFFELGCIFHIDIGDNPTWGDGNGTNIAVYALMRVSF